MVGHRIFQWDAAVWVQRWSQYRGWLSHMDNSVLLGFRDAGVGRSSLRHAAGGEARAVPSLALSVWGQAIFFLPSWCWWNPPLPPQLAHLTIACHSLFCNPNSPLGRDWSSPSFSLSMLRNRGWIFSRTKVAALVGNFSADKMRQPPIS